MKQLTLPVSEEEILDLRAGDAVQISGIAITGRDAAHKYMVETLIEGAGPMSDEDRKVHDELKEVLRDGAIYHCGPIVKEEDGRWSFVSSGPTTSSREEPYQDRIIAAFGLRVIIGKGGMGKRTLEACRKFKAVYVHGTGGAGVYNAKAVSEVIDVYKKDDFGFPEAMWKIRLSKLTGVVTMDAHGTSLHAELADRFDRQLAKL